jgi:dienelactone hydrolase
MRLYEAVPDIPARGAVVVIQEAFGVNPHIEAVTRRFADAGYHAVAPDMFHRTGRGAVVRNWPMVPGIDLAGVVDLSAAPELEDPLRRR